MVKHTQKNRRFLPANCLSLFEHFVGFALIRLNFAPFSISQTSLVITLISKNGIDSFVFVTDLLYKGF